MSTPDSAPPAPDADPDTPEPARTSPATRLAVAAGCGVVAGTVTTALSGHVGMSLLVGWVVTATLFVVWTWLHLWPLTAEDTARHATREDPTRRTAHAILVIASVASIVGMAFVFFSTSTDDKEISAGVAILSSVVSWVAIHTLYSLAYARTYYTEPRGGIDFHQDEPPRYSDFAYVAFTVGMSYAVSDNDVESSAMRRVTLAHALLSYLFGTVILAALINLVTSL